MELRLTQRGKIDMSELQDGESHFAPFSTAVPRLKRNKQNCHEQQYEEHQGSEQHNPHRPPGPDGVRLQNVWIKMHGTYCNPTILGKVCHVFASIVTDAAVLAPPISALKSLELATTGAK